MSGVFTIPAQAGFAQALTQGLARRAQGDPLALSDALVFLPTRRACRAVREAFLSVAEARATLLPRLLPLGDPAGEGEDDVFEGLMAGEEEGLPAIAPLRRQMLLIQCLLKKDPSLPLDQAAALAQALASLIDQTQTAQCRWERLQTLVPATYARHWQETLKFLEIVTAAWPAILEEEACVDPVVHRAALLERQLRLWAVSPPSAPVIVAGSTGSVPAVGRFMKAVAALPRGEVVLPALDLSLDEESWQAIDEAHPQFTMKGWLDASGLSRADVSLWPAFRAERGAEETGFRARLLQEALRPAATTGAWQRLGPNELPQETTKGLEALTLEHAREEADVIALRLRGALEEEGKTAALVTFDRALAARVATALTRWGIEANDSAGAPLDRWPVGRFLIEALKAASPRAGAIDMLALLKHPLAALGMERSAYRSFVQEAEITLWRGIRRADLLAEDAALSPAARESLERLASLISPLAKKWDERQPAQTWIENHVAFSEELAREEGRAADAPSRVWRGEDGEAAAAMMDEWRLALCGFPEISGEDYLSLFETLARQTIVRSARGRSPRVQILGPLEARLLRFDLVILGGLNEGVWPPQTVADPWLSRPMKKTLGLSLPELRIGLSAHDFVQQMCSPRVLMTRARRAAGAPAVPSRFWLQIEAVLQAAGFAEGSLVPAQPWAAWAGAMDGADGGGEPCPPPAPRPPVEARPKQLSVTEIKDWLANPYALYAKHILNLKPLDPIDAEPTAATFGSIVHAALESFLKEEGALCEERLLSIGRAAFEPYAKRPAVSAFWWPRFERFAAWFVANEQMRRKEGIKPCGIEAKGSLTFSGGAFTLIGRADRVDLLPDGAVEIIDYKTGYVPTKKSVESGAEPQLPLLALMARTGALRDVPPLPCARAAYWKLQEMERGAEGRAVTAFASDIEELAARAQEGVAELVRTFNDAATPYRAEPRAATVVRHNDYAHLSRVLEWRGEREGDEGGGE